MTLPLLFRSRVARGGFALLLLAIFAAAAQANPALEGYADDAEFNRRVQALAKSKLVRVESLAKTSESRAVVVLTLGTGKVDAKPAILVVGNVDAAHVAGSELALRTAEQLVAGYAKDKATQQLLDRVTLYVIPRPHPDGTAKNFAKPYREQSGNARRTDDDRDFEIGEDPPEDLNGDGWITMLRVSDATGEYMPHPNEPRVMIKADAKKNERGRYRLLSEGKDNDGDEQFNEDAADGVNFNRNFPHKYPAFKPAAGPNAVSEIETRAIADFAFDHANIAAVFTFTPEDNLLHGWEPNATAEKARIKTTLLTDDAPLQKFIAEKYRKLHGGKDAPKPPAGAGSFSDWAYFQYGRWSFAARGWWVPKMSDQDDKAEKKETPKEGEKASEMKEQPDAKDAEQSAKSMQDSRGADEINALRWFDGQEIDGFVEWQEIKHPDFPNSKVEVGGFKPFYRLNPPVAELDPLAKKHAAFLTELGELFPKLEIEPLKIESLGAVLYRVTATILNTGYLPTESKMGDLSRQLQRLQVELNLPKDARMIQSTTRRSLPRLTGSGGKHEVVWLVRIGDKKNNKATIRVWSPAVGEAKQQVILERKRST